MDLVCICLMVIKHTIFIIRKDIDKETDTKTYDSNNDSC